MIATMLRPVLAAASAAALALCLGINGNHIAAAEAVETLLAELRQSIPQDELEEPGSTVWPQTVSEAADMADELGLSPEEVLALRLAAAESWIAAGDGAAAAERAAALLNSENLPPALRQRAGLALVAAWQEQVERARETGDDEALATIGDPLATLASFGDFDALVLARAHVVSALQILLASEPAVDDALAHYDTALGLLSEQAPAHRVPVYVLRLQAMELTKATSGDIRAWVDAHQHDPAMSVASEALFTGSQQLVGQAAPPLTAPRLDSGAARNLQWQALRGRVVLVFFSASWSAVAQEITPQVVAIQQAHKDTLQVIEVSLDTRDTIPQLANYIARFGITHPIIGEGMGWDGELNKAWHVDVLPTLIVVDAQGRVSSNNLADGDPAATRARIEEALRQLAASNNNEAESSP